MERLLIEGPRTLRGDVRIDGAKNAALPACVASLLTDESVYLHSVPQLRDVSTILYTLGTLGKRVVRSDDSAAISSDSPLTNRANPFSIRQMRASFLVVGPLVARLGEAFIPLPGGCAIGKRPVDLHLQVLRALGAYVEERPGQVHVTANGLHGGRIDLPYPSVGATEQALMTAALAHGETSLTGGSIEPEVLDLMSLLISMGSHIEREGRVYHIAGRPSLGGAEHRLIPDRIEAGTYLILGAASGGSITVRDVEPRHLEPLIDVLRQMGHEIEVADDSITLNASATPSPISIATAPHPGFPTDLHPPLAAHLCTVPGESVIKETVFENRFAYLSQLRAMGSQHEIAGDTVRLRGVDRLYSADVEATDLRAGAALIIAALTAQGRTTLRAPEHVDRGYAHLERKIHGLGGHIERESD